MNISSYDGPGQIAAFDRMSAAVRPAEVAEHATLVAREAAALSDRVEAFAALGLAAASLNDDVVEDR